MAKIKSRYVCQSCGAEQVRWMGRCPECNEWNTLVEEAVAPTPVVSAKAAAAAAFLPKTRPMPMAEVEMTEEDRLPTGLGELDRVLGGGVVPGSMVLLGGDPGIGKCLVGDTRVLDPRTGAFLPIASWKETNRPVLALDEPSGKLRAADVSLFHERGVHPIVEVETSLGRRLVCTPEHPVLTPQGWQPIGRLPRGTRIASPRALPIFGTEALPIEQVKLLAYILSDGSAQASVDVTTVLPEVVEELEELAMAFGMTLQRYPKAKTSACSYRFVLKGEQRAAARQQLAEALREAKRQSGLSWTKWARRAKTTPAMLNMWRRAACVPSEEELAHLAEAIGVEPRALHPDARALGGKVTPVAAVLEEAGVRYARATDKKVPEGVFTLPKEQLAVFLRVLFTCDGSVYLNGRGVPGLSYSTISRRLAEDVQHLLLRFGFVAKLRTKLSEVGGEPYTAYEVQMLGVPEVQRFLAEIGIWGRQEAQARIRALPLPTRSSTHWDTIPTGAEFWQELARASDGMSFARISERAGTTVRNRRHDRPLCRTTVQRLSHAFFSPLLEKLADGDVYWDAIERIEPKGEAPVFDLTVPGPANFVANDLIVHNSTITLQVAQLLAASGKKIVYASGEESARQIRLRARRLGAEHPNLYVHAETDMRAIEAALLELRPDWAVIDSIQAIYDPESNSLPGSVSQVRAATGRLLRIAKEEGIALCLVGHVTKEGTLAGPRVLEHMVDTVLYFEGDRFKSHRLIRAVKNRFGATNEVGIFEMIQTGLKEVTNPSELFLAERSADASGSAIVPTMEGTRPLLVEVQALVSASMLAQPRRSATGVEHNRLVQILAVLEKRVGLGLSKADVYVNVAGGLDISEPAADLAIALAVASSLRDVSLPAGLVAIGEVGLNGEIRAVSSLEARLREAAKLGFSTALVPSHSLSGVETPPGLEVIGVSRLMEAIVKATGGAEAPRQPAKPEAAAPRGAGRGGSRAPLAVDEDFEEDVDF